MKIYSYYLICCVLITLYTQTQAQSITNLTFTTDNGLFVSTVANSKGEIITLLEKVPLFTLKVNNKLTTIKTATYSEEKKEYNCKFTWPIDAEVKIDYTTHEVWKAAIKLTNTSSKDTLDISNIVPFGQNEKNIHITAEGPASLTRAQLFRPGLGALNIILPDNAWELGYGAIPLNNTFSLCALSRRTDSKAKAQNRRFKTILPPGASVEYSLWIDNYKDEWQNGLKQIFQKRMLFDLPYFDSTLYQRNDLKWIRNKYLISLNFSWDHTFYDAQKGKYGLYDHLFNAQRLLGGYDIYAMWPTWPRLGLDQRNQWDLYSDLPGGLKKIRDLVALAKKNGTHFFIEFNPWDQSTRKEDPYKGMARLIQQTDADGVVLDTQGSSSTALQHAADSIKKGVIMYSEGMAVVKDMPGIVSGRVHDAIYLSPPLNMNKLIKPEFAIFRVLQLSQGPIHREVAISLFNGYGNEMNTMAPGRSEWMEEEFRFLGKATKILRENTSAFLSQEWKPLLPTLKDSIWVNSFPTQQKTIYTILSFAPSGHIGPMFEIKKDSSSHFVSLWNHEELEPVNKDGKWMAPVKVMSFNQTWKDTREEGNVDVVAQLPKLINARLKSDILNISTKIGDSICIWAGNPSYEKIPYVIKTGNQTVKLYNLFGRYEGKIVIQLFAAKELLDERILNLKEGSARIISETKRTKNYPVAPEGMVQIPSGEFIFNPTNDDNFIPYPEDSGKVKVESFYLDVYPVTNEQFYQFLKATEYIPSDPQNFLKHWEADKYIESEKDYPVVWINSKDAAKYCEWAGKRLPSEKEWQWAAQGPKGFLWPWGNSFDPTRCNNASGKPTAVNAFETGISPFGVKDMVGNVWQLTNDLYDNGSHYFTMIRGGSFYKPTSSWWYIKGGPQPLNQRQMLLIVGPGLDRNATVGFRCAADVKP